MVDKPPKILIADDEPATLQLLIDVLEPDGYELFIAPNATAAVELALAHEPDLLLLDVVMADGGGYAICEALHARAPERELAVIFLTALAQPEELQDGFAAGAVDYITKPFSTALLRSRVHTWLSRLAEQRAGSDRADAESGWSGAEAAEQRGRMAGVVLAGGGDLRPALEMKQRDREAAEGGEGLRDVLGVPM